VRGLQHPADKGRGIHQLDPHRPMYGPAAQHQHRAKPASINPVNFREVDYKDPDTFQPLEPVTELIEFLPTNQAPGATDNGYVVQAFDLVFELHTLIHTNQPEEKFPEAAHVDWTGKEGKGYRGGSQVSGLRTQDSGLRKSKRNNTLCVKLLLREMDYE
jgi:hypothetical protein